MPAASNDASRYLAGSFALDVKASPFLPFSAGCIKKEIKRMCDVNLNKHSIYCVRQVYAPWR